MPLTIRLFFHVLLLSILFLPTIEAQSKSECFDIADTNRLQKAFLSFENDIFNHYKCEDTLKTYRTFLAEVASLSINIRKLPSPQSIALTREFKTSSNNENSLWVKLSDYEKPETSHLTTDTDTTPADTGKHNEEVLTFNYRGGFIQCLKNTSEISDFQEIITSLEQDGNISPSLTSQKVYYLLDKDLNTIEVKSFIAFDIYYSILMVVEKAFK